MAFNPSTAINTNAILQQEMTRRGIPMTGQGQGMDPVTIAALISAGSGIANSLLNRPDDDEDQQVEPYTGIAAPQFQMEQLLKGLMQYGRARTELARRPFTASSSFAQPVAGTTGVDPAFTDRSLLTVPGLDLPDLFPDLGPVYSQDNPGPPKELVPGAAYRTRPPGAEITGFAVPRGWPSELPSPTSAAGTTIKNGIKYYVTPNGLVEAPPNEQKGGRGGRPQDQPGGDGTLRRRPLGAGATAGAGDGLAPEMALESNLASTGAGGADETTQATGAVQLLTEIAGRAARGRRAA